MGVPGPEAGEQDFLRIGPAIAVGVTNMDKVSPVSNVGPAMSKGETGRHVQPAHEGRDLVGAAIPVAILKDQELVSGFLAGLELGVGPGAKDPESTLRIPAHAYGIGDPHRLIGKEVDLVAILNLEGGLLSRNRVVRLRPRNGEGFLGLQGETSAKYQQETMEKP